MDTEKGGVYLRKMTWGTEEESFWFGIADLTLEALMTEEPTAWSYVSVRKDLRNEDTRTRLLQAAKTIGIDKVAGSTGKYPVFRYLQLGDVRADPVKLRESLLAEFDLLAKLVPDIDSIVGDNPGGRR